MIKSDCLQDLEETQPDIDLTCGQALSPSLPSQPVEWSAREVEHCGTTPSTTYGDAQEDSSVCPSAEYVSLSLSR